MAKKPKLKSGFTLGGEQAEADPLLEQAFYQSSDYEVVESRDDPRCFVVGRTGSGKSAALQHLEESWTDHVIRINPEDLSLPYITDLHVIRFLDSLDVNLDLFWIALWKHVLLVEIIRFRYKVNSPEAKRNFMQNLREKLGMDPGKKAALEYLNEFEGRFWCETQERVKEITDTFTKKIDAAADGSVTAPGFGSAGTSLGTSNEQSKETRTELVERYQRIVNQTQLAKLNKMIEVLNEDILDKQHHTYVVIDDLDRDWVDERLANDLIRCLFRTVLDLKRVQNLKILVALRTNIFQELDFGRRGGGQEEKFRSLVLSVRWTRNDLEKLLSGRVRVAAETAGLEAQQVGDLFPNPNKTRGNPLDYILDRTLLRPRDAIAFVNECLALGIGKSRLTWDDINNAEAEYSTKRLLALRDEWKPTYPGIDQILMKFRGSSTQMSRDELQAILEDSLMLLASPDFPGIRWLTDMSERVWAPGDFTWFEAYQPLAAMLYSLGFLGASIRPSGAPIFYAEDPHLLATESNLNEHSRFFVHRAYQAALGIRPSRWDR